ncbi:MAG TPA: nicotinate-nucleotide adenylyltransferase [Acidimicrobiales bacterium]|nr:nicotinate-nucleotide adenylyltransferase [Acidimicrobiales bacterium]
MHTAPKRIGILGGTFDPPHVGHVVAAVGALWELDLNVVLLMTANIPWQKTGTRSVTSAADRLAMVTLLAEGVAKVQVSTLELDRGGRSFTGDTVEEVKAEHPGAELFVIVGSDVAALLGTWKKTAALKAGATIVVYDRPGSVGASPPEDWSFRRIDVPQLAVSSTDIRARCAEGRPIDGLVPPAVLRYITDRRLYVDDGEAAPPVLSAP